MLAVLLESRAAHPCRLGSTLLSALAHGAVIAAVVALTLPGRGSAGSAPPIHSTTVTYVRTVPLDHPPTPRPAASSQATESRTPLPVIAPPVITPVGIPPIDLALPVTSANDIHIGNRGDISRSPIASPGTSLGGAGAIHDATLVDRAPGIIGRGLEPRYPAALRAAGVEGRVLAEFVVDTLGHAELTTLRFPELPDPRFSDAVREALVRYQFSPGEVAGRKVRTRVALPFEFKLVR
jgi:protein TonB